MTTKTCNRCQIEKTLDQYNKAARNKDGLRAYCRECQRIENAKTNRKDGEWYATKQARQQDRRAIKINAMPSWANKKAITKVSKATRELTQATGVQYHIGHIHPLNSDLVCGLHIAANLMPEIGSINISHNNDFKPYRIDADGNYYELMAVDFGRDLSNPVYTAHVWSESYTCTWNPSIGSAVEQLNNPYSI